jgi:hypothetical protein
MRDQSEAGVNTAVVAAGLSRAGFAAHSGVHVRVASYCRGPWPAIPACSASSTVSCLANGTSGIGSLKTWLTTSTLLLGPLIVAWPQLFGGAGPPP